MRIAVIGAGGVGGYFGGRLAQAGHDVTFVARGRHLAALRERGLRLESARGDATVARATATDDPGGDRPVRRRHVLRQAVGRGERRRDRSRRSLRRAAWSFPSRTGSTRREILKRVLGADKVVGGVAYIAATIREPGVIAHTGTMARLVVGAFEGGNAHAAAAFRDACVGAGVDAELSADISRTLWEKFCFLSALSGTTSLARQPLGVVRSDPDLRRDVRGCGCAKRGRSAARAASPLADDLVAKQLAALDALPAEMRSSMQNDLAAGNRLEAPWLSGAVAAHVGRVEARRAGERHAVRRSQAVRRRRAATLRESPRMRLILTWLINAVALFALPYIFTSIKVDTPLTALLVAVVLGLINTLIRPILDPAHAAGDDPDARPVHLRDQRPPVLGGRHRSCRGFQVGGFWAGVFGAIVYSLISWLLSSLLMPSRKDERGVAMAKAAGTYSFEFFPPKTPEGIAKLRATRAQLAQLKPAFCSVTFGAGGSTREGTLDTVVEMLGEGLRGRAAPVVHRRQPAIAARRAGAVPRRTASGTSLRCAATCRRAAVDAGEFRYASDLVGFIREETGDWFHIDVACYPEYHPQARNPQEDLDHFERKVRAGADSAITQYFFNARRVLELRRPVRRARASRSRSCPGIMPIASSASRLARFSDACGAEIPRWIRRKLEGYGDDTASVREFGLDVVTDLCARLLDEGAPGLHFYTLNTAGLTTTIWQRLGL